MIEFLIPPQESGGVFDYTQMICGGMPPGSHKITHIDESRATAWNPAKSTVVYLQMSGYGFAKRGAPTWLPLMISRHRSQISSLVVNFHELYASGPPWTSAFWLSRIQQDVVKKLAAQSDYCITSRRAAAKWLGLAVPNIRCTTLAVPSNVGELPNPELGRSKSISVFGSEALRSQTYQKLFYPLRILTRDMGYAIHDIGKTIANANTRRIMDRLSTVEHGQLPINQVSAILQQSKIGALHYPTGYLAKSGVFAAYSAHALIPLVSGNPARSNQHDGLIGGKHYMLPETISSASKSFEPLDGYQAWLWYQQHTVAKHINTILAIAKSHSDCLAGDVAELTAPN